MNSALLIRLAGQADLPQIDVLMTLSIRALQSAFLTPEQIEASFEVMGLDTRLIEDQTYFAVMDGGVLVGCGGWSRRATLFGGDHSSGRDASLLDPGSDPARVRAMYTHPDHARRGIGRMILDACEGAARKEGFRTAQLAATLAGVPLYKACGYKPIEEFTASTKAGLEIPLVRMGKNL